MSEQEGPEVSTATPVQLHNEQMKLLQFTADLLDAVAKDLEDMQKKVRQTNRTVQFLGFLVVLNFILVIINAFLY